MNHNKVARDLTAARTSSPDLFISPERSTREALAWAIPETVLRLPPSARPDAWKWDADDASLRFLADDGEFRFHVSAERRGSRMIRIAVMSVHDDNGRATWDAQMPSPSRKG